RGAHARTDADPALWRKLRRRAAMTSLGIATLLATAKIVGAFVTGSVGVLSSLADSLADVAASGLTFWTVELAHRPADEDHRYGHGRAEALSSLVQAALVVASAIFVVYVGVGRLFDPEPLREGRWAIAVMALSVAGSLTIVGVQRATLRRVESVAIEADSLHYKGDVLSNLAIIAGLLVASRPGLGWVDPVIGGLIALYLMVSIGSVARRSIDQLMDRELSEDERARVAAVVEADPDVRGFHDLRTRSLGVSAHIDLHLELDGHLDLVTAHEITDRVERALLTAFPGSSVTIHTEPFGLDDDRLDDRVRDPRGA
ncbi:MAG: cation diffusion facilitator family transporter, partial [Planctomycetota bacterium]